MSLCACVSGGLLLGSTHRPSCVSPGSLLAQGVMGCSNVQFVSEAEGCHFCHLCCFASTVVRDSRTADSMAEHQLQKGPSFGQSSSHCPRTLCKLECLFPKFNWRNLSYKGAQSEARQLLLPVVLGNICPRLRLCHKPSAALLMEAVEQRTSPSQNRS